MQIALPVCAVRLVLKIWLKDVFPTSKTPPKMWSRYKLVCHISLPAETVIWLPQRLSMISCFLPWLLYAKNGFLSRLPPWLCFLPIVSAGSRVAWVYMYFSRKPFIMHSHLSRDWGQSWRKPNMTCSFGRKHKNWLTISRDQEFLGLAWTGEKTFYSRINMGQIYIITWGYFGGGNSHLVQNRYGKLNRALDKRAS